MIPVSRLIINEFKPINKITPFLNHKNKLYKPYFNDYLVLKFSNQDEENYLNKLINKISSDTFKNFDKSFKYRFIHKNSISPFIFNININNINQIETIFEFVKEDKKIVSLFLLINKSKIFNLTNPFVVSKDEIIEFIFKCKKKFDNIKLGFFKISIPIKKCALFNPFIHLLKDFIANDELPFHIPTIPYLLREKELISKLSNYIICIPIHFSKRFIKVRKIFLVPEFSVICFKLSEIYKTYEKLFYSYYGDVFSYNINCFGKYPLNLEKIKVVRCNHDKYYPQIGRAIIESIL